MKNIFILTLLLACGIVYAQDSSSHLDETEIDLDSVTLEFMKLLNDYRHDLGLRPITHSNIIARSAYGHSLNMSQKIINFGHLGSSARCSSIQKSLGGGNLCGEIVAMGQKNAAAVFKSWKNSPGHRGIMSNARYTHAGLGYHKSSSGSMYWTQIFLEME